MLERKSHFVLDWFPQSFISWGFFQILMMDKKKTSGKKVNKLRRNQKDDICNISITSGKLCSFAVSAPN